MQNSFIKDFIAKHKLSGSFCDIAPKWFIPVAKQVLLKSKTQQTPLFIGINGCQGSGKSTLTDFIADYIRQFEGLNVAVLSLDDFYLDKDERGKLATNIHPLFKTRGVPGTHNTKLMRQVLMGLKQNNLPIALPRFNKATDNPHPEPTWPIISETPDIVIFEGWCWGVPSQSAEELTAPINPLEAELDNTGAWRTYSNSMIKNEYSSLYLIMDYWLMLKAPSFECVSHWRKEQEHKLAEKTKGTGTAVMSDDEVETFIQHYQRLTEHGLAHVPLISDIVLELDHQRNILSATGLEQ